MKKNSIKVEYDADVDAAYLKLKNSAVAESEEVRQGIVVDFDSSNQVVGVEILRFTKRFRRAATKPARVRRTSAE